MTPSHPPDRTPIRRWAKLRLWVGYAYLLCAVLLAGPQPIGVVVGLVLVLLGVTVRLLSSATLIKDAELCTSGIYSATRNPLYLGSALVGLAFAFLSGSLWFFIAFFAVLAPLYWWMIVLEEAYLNTLHPAAFAEYRRSVPRFLPRLSTLGNIPSTLDLSLLRKSREPSSAALILLLAAILLAWHRTWLTL